MPRKPQINLSDALPQPKPQGGQPKLAKEMRGHSRKLLTHEFVAAEIAKAGYVLRSKYKNSRTHIDIECDQEHQYPGTWHGFRKGKRCPSCRSRKLTHEYVASEIAKAGSVLRSRYYNSCTKLDIECDKGHRYPAIWSVFNKGHGCPRCAGNEPLTHEYVASEVAKAGYVLRSRYYNSCAKLDIECDKGHRYPAAWKYFQQGARCPECFPGGYKPNKLGRLYYVRFDFPDGLSLYKIGITNRTIGHRFADEPTPYTVLLDLRYKDGSMPPQEERRILTDHAKYKYKGPNLLVSGNTECFTRDVLKLDTAVVQLPLPICGAA